MSVRKAGEEKGKSEAVETLKNQQSEEVLSPQEAETEDIEVKFEDLSLEEQEKYLKDHGLWE
jgi:hypothetical protein